MSAHAILEDSLAAVVLGIWVCIGLVHLWSLRTGFIMGITAGPRAIRRSERPARFWATWLLLAFPFVFLPILALAGLALQIFEN